MQVLMSWSEWSKVASLREYCWQNTHIWDSFSYHTHYLSIMSEECGIIDFSRSYSTWVCQKDTRTSYTTFHQSQMIQFQLCAGSLGEHSLTKIISCFWTGCDGSKNGLPDVFFVVCSVNSFSFPSSSESPGSLSSNPTNPKNITHHYTWNPSLW